MVACWSDSLLEVLLGVIPALYQPVTQTQCCSRICLLTGHLVPISSKCVLQVIYNALLNASHITSKVRICSVGMAVSPCTVGHERERRGWQTILDALYVKSYP